MSSLSHTYIPTHTSSKAAQTRTGTRRSQSQSIIEKGSTKTENLRYHLRLQLASAVDRGRTKGPGGSGSDWQFVPPCLISTTSGALSPHIFHRSLEKIHCDHTLYPHLEENIFQEEFAYESDGEQEQLWHAICSTSTREMDTDRTTADLHASHTKHIVVEVGPNLKESSRLGGAKMQYGTTRQPSHILGYKSHNVRPDHWHFRNRGRLASSRWSFFHKWHDEAEPFTDDRRTLLLPGAASWNYTFTRSPIKDSADEDQERALVFGSYIAVVGLIFLSLWVLGHHNHLH